MSSRAPPDRRPWCGANPNEIVATAPAPRRPCRFPNHLGEKTHDGNLTYRGMEPHRPSAPERRSSARSDHARRPDHGKRVSLSAEAGRHRLITPRQTRVNLPARCVHNEPTGGKGTEVSSAIAMKKARPSRVCGVVLHRRPGQRTRREWTRSRPRPWRCQVSRTQISRIRPARHSRQTRKRSRPMTVFRWSSSTISAVVRASAEPVPVASGTARSPLRTEHRSSAGATLPATPRPRRRAEQAGGHGRRAIAAERGALTTRSGATGMSATAPDRTGEESGGAVAGECAAGEEEEGGGEHGSRRQVPRTAPLREVRRRTPP